MEPSIVCIDGRTTRFFHAPPKNATYHVTHMHKQNNIVIFLPPTPPTNTVIKVKDLTGLCSNNVRIYIIAHPRGRLSCGQRCWLNEPNECVVLKNEGVYWYVWSCPDE